MSDERVPDKIELDDSETGFTFPVSPPVHTPIVDPERGPDSEQADLRLYIPDHQRWSVQVKRNSENEYCCSTNPGENYFHLLLEGEIYLEHGSEKYCLTCGVRQKIITADRLFWQFRGEKR